ncbi:hypothetical protein [Adhaeribacter aerolatus]|nr:hypothetical protein [Adhaeribacter aerolatus]
MKKIFIGRALLLLLFLLANLTGTLAQNKPTLQIRFSPLNVLDLRAATLQFGAQATLKSRIGFSIDYGLPYKGLSKQFVKNEEYQYRNHEYFKLRGEIIYFFPAAWGHDKANVKPYVSTAVFFSPEEYRKTDNWLVKPDGDYHYEYSDVNRRMWGTCLKVGLEYYLGQRFLLDAFVGPGLRWIKVDHQTFGEQPGDYKEPVDFYFEPVDRQEGKFRRLHLGFNVKLGFVMIK